MIKNKISNEIEDKLTIAVILPSTPYRTSKLESMKPF